MAGKTKLVSICYLCTHLQHYRRNPSIQVIRKGDKHKKNKILNTFYKIEPASIIFLHSIFLTSDIQSRYQRNQNAVPRQERS